MLAPLQRPTGYEDTTNAGGDDAEVEDADNMEVGLNGNSLQVPGSRRPTLLGSPMRSPIGGPCWRNGDVMPAFSLDGEEAANLQAAIEASLGNDMKRRLSMSLQDTEQELCAEYPDDSADSESSQRAKRRRRISSDLDQTISEVATTPKVSPAASPTLAPAAAPQIVVKEAPDSDAMDAGQGCVCDAQAFAGEFGLEYAGLLDHETLLEHLYAASGLDLHAQQERVTQLLAEFNLRSLDLGVKNLDEDGRELVNQCFYLSIARSYLGHTPGLEEVQKVALVMKRTVEACVLQAHPDWAKDDRRLGENAMAFADFLPIAMAAKEPPNLSARLAVVVLDATQCCAEAYLGPLYANPGSTSASLAAEGSCADSHSGGADRIGDSSEAIAGDRSREELERHLVLLVYTPGHYKALVRDDVCGSKPAWTYSEFKALLDERGVMCIETCDFD